MREDPALAGELTRLLGNSARHCDRVAAATLFCLAPETFPGPELGALVTKLLEDESHEVRRLALQTLLDFPGPDMPWLSIQEAVARAFVHPGDYR